MQVCKHLQTQYKYVLFCNTFTSPIFLIGCWHWSRSLFCVVFSVLQRLPFNSFLLHILQHFQHLTQYISLIHQPGPLFAAPTFIRQKLLELCNQISNVISAFPFLCCSTISHFCCTRYCLSHFWEVCLLIDSLQNHITGRLIHSNFQWW